jgi:hypothetical protein
MNNTTYTPSDAMPYEVATRMLTTRTIRMTNKERKHCKRVREAAAPSMHPIVKVGRAYQYNDKPPEPYSLTRQLGRKTFKQLRNLAKRLPLFFRRLVRARLHTSKQELRDALTKRIEAIEAYIPFLELELFRRGTTIKIAL